MCSAKISVPALLSSPVRYGDTCTEVCMSSKGANSCNLAIGCDLVKRRRMYFLQAEGISRRRLYSRRTFNDEVRGGRERRARGNEQIVSNSNHAKFWAEVIRGQVSYYSGQRMRKVLWKTGHALTGSSPA